MDASQIDAEWVRSLDTAVAGLMNAIQRAIARYQADSLRSPRVASKWQSPEPWQMRVLPNLERDYQNLQRSAAAFRSGSMKSLTLSAAGFIGLAKDMAFDTSWMSDADRTDIGNAIEQVVRSADRIHRHGYRVLQRQANS